MEKLDKLDLTIPTTEQKPKHKFIPSVQKKDLIDEGNDLERFMSDDDISVRHYLMDNHPEFIPEMVAMSSDNYAMACYIVETRKDISADILDILITKSQQDRNELQGGHKKRIDSFMIKRNAMQQEPSLLERTMSLQNYMKHSHHYGHDLIHQNKYKPLQKFTQRQRKMTTKRIF